MKLKIAKGGIKGGTWSHRVIGHIDRRGETYWLIHEVHYDENGNVHGWTEDGIAVGGENLNELKQTLNRMQRALSRPWLIVRDNKLVEEKSGKPARGASLATLPKRKRARLQAVIQQVTKTVRAKR